MVSAGCYVDSVPLVCCFRTTTPDAQKAAHVARSFDIMFLMPL